MLDLLEGQVLTPLGEVRAPADSVVVAVICSADGDALRLRVLSEMTSIESCVRAALCFREMSTGNVIGDLSAIGRTCDRACMSESAFIYCAL